MSSRYRFRISTGFLLAGLLAGAAVGQVAYPPRTKLNMAVFLVDFPEVPAAMRSAFPTAEEWRKTLFEGKIKRYLDTISYGRLAVTGDVFDYSRSAVTLWDGGTSLPKEADAILGAVDIAAPGFDAKKYDKLVFIPCHDARLGGSRMGSYSFKVNGQAYRQGAVVVFYRKGRYNRDAGYPVTDALIEKNSYLIPTSSGKSEEGDTWVDLSLFEQTFLHELIHGLGIGAHARSRTNNGHADYEPQDPDNGTFWDRDYGNQFDIMGRGVLGATLNGGYRDIIGLMDSGMIATVSQVGTRRVTVNPINSKSGKRYIEVLLPGRKSPSIYKNDGYGLEAHTAGHWDTTLNHPELRGNLDGLFVMKIAGLANHLLDMSPSRNIAFSWGTSYDIRDVVLKPGMVYENNDVRFGNVVKNTDGSFSVDILIKGAGVAVDGSGLPRDGFTFPFQVSATMPLPGAATAVVLDWAGRTVARPSAGAEVIDLRQLDAGVYFLRIGRKAPFRFQRFLKMK